VLSFAPHLTLPWQESGNSACSEAAFDASETPPEHPEQAAGRVRAKVASVGPQGWQ